MANTKKYVSLDKLGLYDEKIKKVVSDSDLATLNSAKAYADGLATNYDAAGAAATAEANAKAYADGLAGNYDAAGSAAAAEKNAKDYVDGKDTAMNARVEALENKPFDTYATKTEVEGVDGKFANYRTSADQDAIDATKVAKTDYEAKVLELTGSISDAEANAKAYADGLAGNYDAHGSAATAEANAKAYTDEKDLAMNARVETLENKPFDTYATKTEVEGVDAKFADYTKTADQENIDAEQNRRLGVIEGDYLKAADKTELQEQITANANAISVITEGVDADKIDGLKDLIDWADEHAPEVASIKEDIETVAQAIADQATSDAATFATKTELANEKAALQAEIDADVKVVADDLAGYKTTNAAALDLKADKTQVETDIATAKSGAEAEAARLDAALKAELQAEIDADVKVLADKVGVVPADQTVMGIINKMQAEAYDDTALKAQMASDIATAKQAAIDTAAGDATAKANKALEDAKKYADDEDAKIEGTVSALSAVVDTKAAASDVTALTTRVTTAEGEIDTLQSEMDAVEALAAANKAAHEANAAAIALKASQADLEAVSGRVTALETWHNNFTECSEEEINELFK